MLALKSCVFSVLASVGILMAAIPRPLWAAAVNAVETFQGVARNERGEIVYIEEHRLRYQNGQIKQNDTRYLDAEGKEFAALTSKFTTHPYVPTYDFQDKRFGREDGTRVEDDVVRVYGRKDQAASKTDGSIKLTDNMITGQGLHFFLRDHLEEFSREGVVKTVKFLIPLEGDYYTFRIRPINKPEAAPGTLSLLIEIDNVLLRLFAPRLEVQYDVATKRLLSYEGASNLLTGDESVQNVMITYRYDQGNT